MSETRSIDAIKVIGRSRQDMGNLSILAASIERVGLLHPVVVNSRDELIAGSRRLGACKRLRWTTIPVTVVSSLDDAILAVKAERDENTCRQPLTASEMLSIGAKLEALEKPKAKERQKAGGGGTGSGKLPEPSAPVRDKVAAALGISGRTYEKAKRVVEAAASEPDKFADLPAKMETASVDAAYRELKQRQKATNPESVVEQQKADEGFPILQPGIAMVLFVSVEIVPYAPDTNYAYVQIIKNGQTVTTRRPIRLDLIWDMVTREGIDPRSTPLMTARHGQKPKSENPWPNSVYPSSSPYQDDELALVN